MLSKSMWRARTAVALCALLLASGCRLTRLPWRNEPVGREVNLSFTIENNLLFLTTVRVNGRPGRFFLGTSHAQSVIDPRFAAGAARHVVHLSEKESREISPAFVSLQGLGDGIIGADVWEKTSTVTIDYRSGLVTLNKDRLTSDQTAVYRFTTEPRVTLLVGGETIEALVDTTSPDTLVLPRNSRTARANVPLTVAGTNLGMTSVRYADVATARVGNRVLSKFLVSIDYGRKTVSLWRDPRIAL
jgi:hypothetical protein